MSLLRTCLLTELLDKLQLWSALMSARLLRLPFFRLPHNWADASARESVRSIGLCGTTVTMIRWIMVEFAYFLGAAQPLSPYVFQFSRYRPNFAKTSPQNLAFIRFVLLTVQMSPHFSWKIKMFFLYKKIFSANFFFIYKKFLSRVRGITDFGSRACLCRLPLTWRFSYP